MWDVGRKNVKRERKKGAKKENEKLSAKGRRRI